MACLRRTACFGWLLAAVLLLCPPLPGTAQGAPDLFPYVVRSAQGWIDWQKGLVYGVGKASVQANGGSRLHAMRAAHAAARGNIVKLAYGIQLNDKDQIQTFDGGRLAVVVKAFIKDSEVESEYVQDDPDPHYEVTRVAPLTGIDGLTGELLPRLGAGLPPQALSETPAPGPSGDEGDQPWLVLDARHLRGPDRVTPALFPKILSASGEVVYRLRGTDPQAVRRRGMARYVTTDALLEDADSGALPADPALWIGRLLGVGEARAEDRDRRKKRSKFLVRKVEDLKGLAKTNLVVSEQDARRLKEEDASTDILKKCRVIVVVSGAVGGIEGRLPGDPIRFVRVDR